jgi:hypothetical protein
MFPLHRPFDSFASVMRKITPWHGVNHNRQKLLHKSTLISSMLYKQTWARPLPPGPSFSSARRAQVLLKSLIGTFPHPQNDHLTISFCLSENRTSQDCESCTRASKSPKPDGYSLHDFPASVGIVPIGKSAFARL